MNMKKQHELIELYGNSASGWTKSNRKIDALLSPELAISPKRGRRIKRLKRFLRNRKHAKQVTAKRPAASDAHTKKVTVKRPAAPDKVMRTKSEIHRKKKRLTSFDALGSGRPGLAQMQDLSGCPVNDVDQNIPVAPQMLVDWLYRALDDTGKALDTLAPKKWMIFWGTAIGAERQGGLIRWDYDIDVLVLVDSKATFEYKIWPTFALHMQSLGYRTYIADSGSHYKIAPGVCRPQTAGDEWRDYLWRFTDDKRRKGIRMSRSQLVAQASEQRRATGPIKNPLGHNVLDIDVGIIGNDGFVAVDCMPRQLVSDYLPTCLKKFGVRKYPVAQRSRYLLQRYYGKDFMSKRLYHNRAGQKRTVPKGINGLAMPSPGML